MGDLTNEQLKENTDFEAVLVVWGFGRDESYYGEPVVVAVLSPSEGIERAVVLRSLDLDEYTIDPADAEKCDVLGVEWGLHWKTQDNPVYPAESGLWLVRAQAHYDIEDPDDGLGLTIVQSYTVEECYKLPKEISS